MEEDNVADTATTTTTTAAVAVVTADKTADTDGSTNTSAGMDIISSSPDDDDDADNTATELVTPPPPSLTQTSTTSSTTNDEPDDIADKVVGNDDVEKEVEGCCSEPASDVVVQQEEEVVVDVKVLYENPGRPMKDRDETVKMIEALVGPKVDQQQNASETTSNSKIKGKKKKKNNKNKKIHSNTRNNKKVSITSNNNVTKQDDDDRITRNEDDGEEVNDDDLLQPPVEPDNARVQRRPPLSNVYGDGPFLVSDIPKSCINKESDNNTTNNKKNSSIVLGIDEAGRGSVLGPMVYGAAYWNVSDSSKIPKDFNDSKQLSHEQRETLFAKILYETPEIGFVARIIHASEISRNMFRNYNLNQMSHNAARDMIQHVLDAGVNVSHCYVDTVGNADSYEKWLSSQFPNIQFTVESKADAKYPSCSAASVVAKVVRDRMSAHWKFTEEPYIDATTEFGSGYPSDQTCVKWLEQHKNCGVFGYPDVVRFSWGPVKKALLQGQQKSTGGVRVVAFAADRDEDEEEEQYSLQKQQDRMSIFLGKKPAASTAASSSTSGRGSKRKRYSYFERKGLDRVTNL